MNLAMRRQTAAVNVAQIALNGERVLLDPRGVMYAPDQGILAVSDLHLEKGSAFARRGMMVPPYDTRQTLLRLAAIVEEYAPGLVISLGDSFHDDGGLGRMHEDCRALLVAMAAGRDWVWIAGNHDPAPPQGIPGTAANELAIATLVFRHEPQGGLQAGEVAGHLHPSGRIVQRGRSVRRPCFATDGVRLIMPAFGAYTGTLCVRDRAYRGLFEEPRLKAYMIGPDCLYAIDGARLV